MWKMGEQLCGGSTSLSLCAAGRGALQVLPWWALQTLPSSSMCHQS